MSRVMNHHAWFYVVLRTEDNASFIPSKHSTGLATAPFHHTYPFNWAQPCFPGASLYVTFTSFIGSLWVCMLHMITLI